MTSSLEKSDIEKFLAEYQVNVQLWHHDDSLRQQRSANFLTINAVLLTGLAAFVALEVPPRYLSLIGLVFFLFGVLICRVWHLVQVRNSEYIRFRRYQLRSIEARLENLSTFQNTYAAFYENETIKFLGIEDEFTVKGGARERSTSSEAMLPTIVGLFWVAIGTFAGVVSFLG